VTSVSSPPSPLRQDLRSQWMLRPGLTFLNHGSFGAVPRQVFDVQTEWRARIEAEPIEMLGRRSAELIDEAKIPVGKMFGMKPADFGFVTNATEAANAVLRSLNLRPGDELLTTDHVYHAIRQTMKLTARRAGATVREVAIPLPVTSAEQIRDAVLNAISPSTRLLVIDHVTSPTGLVFPLEAIIKGCRERGVEVLADGAHTPGMLPLDVEKIGATYYVANLHKWVCAPKGSAFVWVSPDRQADVHPTVISHHLDDGFAREFSWQGTRDISSWLTVPTAIAFMADLGWDAVMEHNHRLAAWAHQMLIDRWNVKPLSPVDGALLGSLATVSLPAALAQLDSKQQQALQQRLFNEFQIEVPLVGWNGRSMLRVACQVYNTPAEYDRLAAVILNLAK
jgi:isopenicillin-N epimerase